MGSVGKLLSRVFGLLSMIVLLSMVVAIPWMLGGVIPLARYTLLAGSLAAAALSAVSVSLDSRRKSYIPLIVPPLAGIGALAFYQLQNAGTSVLSGMQHTIRSTPAAYLASAPSALSLAPDETRSSLALYIALSLIGLTACDQFRKAREIAIAGGVLVVNAIALTSVGLVEIFSSSGFALNGRWLVTENVTAHAFATFINPNNAAGWICLGFSCVTGWAAYLLKKPANGGAQRYGRLNTPLWEQTWQRFVNVVADLTAWQIMAMIVVAFLGTGVMATQSRGGIVALVFGAGLVLLVRSSIRALPGVVITFLASGVAIFAFLHWFELDQHVVGEIKTLRDVDVSTDTRIILWRDALNIVRDFPIFGTGLGSFKFSILPYQSRDTELWFRNADNQFVEMLVEGGVIGFLLMVSVGLAGLLTSISASRRRHARSSDSRIGGSRVSRRLLSAVGLAVGLSTLTQAFSGIFDYGIVLPAASSLFVLIVAGCCGFLNETDSESGILTRAAIPCPRFLLVPIYGVLIWFGYGYMEDQKAAVEINKSLVSAQAVLAEPISAAKLDQVDDEVELLTTRTLDRPDDWVGGQILFRLKVRQFRWNALLAASPDIRADENLARRFRDFRLVSILDRLTLLRTEDPYRWSDTMNGLAWLGGRLAILDSLKEAENVNAFIPRLAEARSRFASMFDRDNATDIAEWAMFLRPASAEVPFDLGMLSLRSSHPDRAREFWQDCLAMSDEFRHAILADAQLHWSVDEAMELFGPRDYAQCVRAAREFSKGDLADALWSKADESWPEVRLPASESICVLRSHHLVHQKRVADAILWLEESLDNPGDNLDVSRQLAILLEGEGRYREAHAQWNRIQYLNPGDTLASAAIARLMNLK